ncbi:MAG: choline-sulfatase [Acidimicrobiales bacterium]|nr:choline-sulfatase [Acidimicrobiales bacterium]RZV45606.1 MAG: choline-sulfatase [Acidimicrobiales bacterium]
MPSSTPNILLIQVDQLTASFLPAYGNTIAKTPNIDDLAEQSAVFDSAYTNFALCAPSRFSMLSGQLASEVGAYDNGAEFTSAIPTFAHYLKAAGYHTSLVGKMHFIGPDQLHGYQERLTTDIYPSTFVWTGDWNEPKEQHSNDARSFTNAGPVTRNVQMDYDEEVLHRARRKLFDLARSVGVDDDQPWHVTVSFTHPHDPYQCRPEDWNRYDTDDIDLPRVSEPADPDPYSARLARQYGLDQTQPTADQVRDARHGYYGSVSYVDNLVGKLMHTLRETQLDGNTVVVFTTDHGDMLGERGLWYKRNFFEAASRIPLMVSWPGSITPARINSNASLVDLLPTFLDLATTGGSPVEPVEELAGHSLLPLLDSGDGDGADVVFGENLSEGATAPILMVKRGSMKYVWSGCDPAQLFDLSADPDELTNVAGDSEVATTEAELHAMVHARWNVEDLARQIAASQKRRAFMRQLYSDGGIPDWRFTPADQATTHVLADDVPYNEWAYSNMLR